MSRRSRGAPSRADPRDSRPADRAATAARVAFHRPASLRDPPTAIAVAVAAACLLTSVSYRIDDPDVWQHLLVGKAIWQLREVPATHLWSWPSYGQPEVLPSWGFRALLWPFWWLGETWGPLAWRWLTTLLAFGILWVASRVMGARGLVPLAVLVLCSLTYRMRTQVRPETLVAVLLALEIWILESRRRGSGPARLGWLIPVAWLWANVHISYYLGLVLIAVHWLDAVIAGRRSRGGRAAPPVVPAGRRAWIGVAAAGVSLLNPFGWRALWQPFEYFLVWRGEPIYRTIVELHPIMWESRWRSGLPLLMLGWPALIAWCARRRGLDVSETLTCAFGSALALSTQRFAGFYALLAAPYVARDLDLWIRSRRWPAWTAGSRSRAALVSVASVAIGMPEWTRPEHPIGPGFRMDQYPVAACDFMAAHGVRGRGFNPYYLGGYQLWRFWPDRERLPFMDVHLSGTRTDRELYAYAFANLDGWQALDRRHGFDYALLDGRQETVRGDRLLDFLDADPAWALVFRDDAAALYLRRDGRLGPVARRFAYSTVPGGQEGLAPLIRACAADSSLRSRARRELERQLAESPYGARAHSLLATLAWISGEGGRAREHLRAALVTDPRTPGAHQRLGLIALAEGRPREAVREFRAELALGRGERELHLFLGRAYQRLGDFAQARRSYRRQLALDPGNSAARESLAVVESGLGR